MVTPLSCKATHRIISARLRAVHRFTPNISARYFMAICGFISAACNEWDFANNLTRLVPHYKYSPSSFDGNHVNSFQFFFKLHKFKSLHFF